MWDKIIDTVAQYGPFPLGVAVGIWIKGASIKMHFKSSEREKDALREQNKDLHDIIKSKDERIDKLHGDINSLTGGSQ